MSKQVHDDATDAAQQSMEELQRRYETLHTRKIQAEAHQKNAAERLEELKTTARAQYGTDDLEALRQKLAEMTTENERRRATYQADLDRIEAELGRVEAEFAQNEAQETGDAP